MPPKNSPKSPKSIAVAVRLPISTSSLVKVPKGAIEGFQERIESNIDWNTFEAACRHHKKRCQQGNITPLCFAEALENCIRNSYLNSFFYDESGLTLQEQWEIALPMKVWDIEKCSNEEEKICFRTANCITDKMIPMIRKAVKTNNRNELKMDLKKVTVLRVINSKMTYLDKELLQYTELLTLNLSGNYLNNLECSYIPEGVRAIELQANGFLMLDSFRGLPSNVVYLGLSWNLLDNASVEGLMYLPDQLVVLDLSDNDIYELEPVLLMLGRLSNLTSLSLAGNPCSVCAVYARATLEALPKLAWLDDREILSDDRPEGTFESHPHDFLSTYFTFNVFRIMSVPPPPKAIEKGVSLTFHVELELPLLDSARRQFLMFRRNESLTEILPRDDSWTSISSTKNFSNDANDGAEGSVVEPDIYAQLTAKDSRIIKHYTTFQSSKISWNKVMNFEEPVVKIFCPDLLALRNTFRSTITVRLIFTQYIPPSKNAPPAQVKSQKSQTNKSSTGREHHQPRPVTGEQVRTVFSVRCSLRRLDWTQPSQHFHWDETLGTNDAVHWGDADLSVLQYSGPGAKQMKGKGDESQDLKQNIPEVMTAHFGFGIDTIRHIRNVVSNSTAKRS